MSNKYRYYWNYYWYFIHYLSANYPVKPTSGDKAEIVRFVKFLESPKGQQCGKCRNDLINYFKEHPIEDQYKTRASVFKYFVDLHNFVNEKLKKPTFSLEKAMSIYQQPHWKDDLVKFGIDILDLFRKRQIDKFFDQLLAIKKSIIESTKEQADKKTSQKEKTSGPSSATSGSSSATSGPSSATTGPSSATTGPSSATTGPSSTTTGPSSATTGPSSASSVSDEIIPEVTKGESEFKHKKKVSFNLDNDPSMDLPKIKMSQTRIEIGSSRQTVSQNNVKYIQQPRPSVPGNVKSHFAQQKNNFPIQVSSSGNKRSVIPKYKLAPLNLTALQQEDTRRSIAYREKPALHQSRSLLSSENLVNKTVHKLPRIAVFESLTKTIRSWGIWQSTQRERRWAQTVECANAKGLLLVFKHLYLPVGTKLEIVGVNSPKEQFILTSKWNTSTGYQTVGPIWDHSVTVSYLQPVGQTGTPNIDLSGVGKLYTILPILHLNRQRIGESDSCQVDVVCNPEGNDYVDQRKGVARIILLDTQAGGFFLCSGSLVNNVRADGTPYFLTAFHCGLTATPTDRLSWLFQFNYEGPTCGYAGPDFSTFTTTGCTLLSSSNDGGGVTGSDYQLLLLDNLSQEQTTTQQLYFNGWDVSGSIPMSGASIHHPSGDIKKISTYTSPLMNSGWGVPNTHWRVRWGSTSNGHGVTEGGSSGSPIFDQNRRVVGQLTGGASFCSTPTLPDFYGKMSYNWNHPNPFNNTLSSFLDPDNTGAVTLDGLAAANLMSPTPPPVSITPGNTPPIFSLNPPIKPTFPITQPPIGPTSTSIPGSQTLPVTTQTPTTPTTPKTSLAIPSTFTLTPKSTATQLVSTATVPVSSTLTSTGLPDIVPTPGPDGELNGDLFDDSLGWKNLPDPKGGFLYGWGGSATDPTSQVGDEFAEYVDYADNPQQELNGISLYIDRLTNSQPDPEIKITLSVRDVVTSSEQIPSPGEIKSQTDPIPIDQIIPQLEDGQGVVNFEFNQSVETKGEPFYLGVKMSGFRPYLTYQQMTMSPGNEFAVAVRGNGLNRSMIRFKNGEWGNHKDVLDTNEDLSSGIRPLVSTINTASPDALSPSPLPTVEETFKSTQPEPTQPEPTRLPPTRPPFKPPISKPPIQPCCDGLDGTDFTCDPYTYIEQPCSTGHQNKIVKEAKTAPNMNREIRLDVQVTNVSSNSSCDGRIRVQAYNGVAPYRYQLDQNLINSEGLFTNLCSGSYTLLVTDSDNNSTSQKVVIGIVCFTRDSWMQTDQGLVRVDRLTPKHTVKGSEIRLVCSTTLPVNSELVEIKPHTFGKGVPDQMTYLTGNHKIYHQKNLVRADRLARQLGLKTMKIVKTKKPVEVFNILLPQYKTIMINNLEIESLHPASTTAREYYSGNLN